VLSGGGVCLDANLWGNCGCRNVSRFCGWGAVWLGRGLALIGAGGSTRGQGVVCPFRSTTLVLDGEFEHSLQFLLLPAPNLIVDISRRWLVGGVKFVVCRTGVSQALDRGADDGRRKDGLLVFKLL
jgi:hypothetical protein